MLAVPPPAVFNILLSKRQQCKAPPFFLERVQKIAKFGVEHNLGAFSCRLRVPSQEVLALALAMICMELGATVILNLEVGAHGTERVGPLSEIIVGLLAKFLL